MCHKTAGLVANELERSGIPTVIVGTMHKPMETVPRAVVTRYVNAPTGPPGATQIQRDVVTKALELLTQAVERRVETYREPAARAGAVGLGGV